MKGLIAIITGLVLLTASCKNRQGGGDDQSLEDSLSGKYGKGSEVIQQLDAEIIKSPGNAELYYKRAQQWAREGNKVKALQDIKAAVNLEPQNALYRFSQGEIAFMNDSVSMALESFNKALEFKPDFPDALLKLGELQFIMFEFSQSNGTFDKLLEQEPINATAWYYKGRNYIGMKDTTRAIEAYKKSVSLDNDNYNSYIQLGNLYYSKGGAKNLDLAIDYFTNAIRVKELSAEAFYARGLAYYDMRANEKAVRDFERVMALDPDDYRPYVNIGLINYDIDQYDAAIESYDKALMLNPEHVKSYYLRGLAHMQRGDNQAAIKDFRVVVQMDTNYRIAQDFLRDLEKKTGTK